MKRFLPLILSVSICFTLFAALATVPANAAGTNPYAESLADYAKQQVGKAPEQLGLPAAGWCGCFVGHCINKSQIKELAGEKIGWGDYRHAWSVMWWACYFRKIATAYIYSEKYYNVLANDPADISVVFSNDSNYVPSKGDVFLMGSRARGDCFHTGIVIGYDPRSKLVHFVDGNNLSNNGRYVNENYISNTDDTIVGYVHWNGSDSTTQPTTLPDSLPTGKPIAQVKITRPTDGLYNLAPACAPNSALDVANKRTDNEANLHIWQRGDNWSNQQWNLERVDGDYYKITNENSGRAVSIQYDSTASGSNLWQYGYGHSNAQKWRFEEAGDGYYYIVPKINTDLCLDVSSASGTDGANVQVYEKNQTNAQKWKLVPVEKPIPIYTVYFDANGGSVAQTSKTVKEGDTIGAMPKPSRKGYTFQGWGSEREGAYMIVTSNNLYILEDTTLYAHWEKIEPASTTPTPAPETPEPLPPIIIEPEQPPVSEAPIISEPPVTPSPEPEQKAESTLKIYGLTATVTDKGICYNCQVSSNYELTSFSSELRDQGGIGVSFEMGWFGKGTSKDTLEYEYKFSRLWKKGIYMITVEAEDASGKEVSASTTIKLPFDIDGNGKPIKNK